MTTHTLGAIATNASVVRAVQVGVTVVACAIAAAFTMYELAVWSVGR